MAEEKGFLEQISGSLTTVTVIAGLFVTLNTHMSTCSKETASQYTAFREAVAKEETYWKGLYDDYLLTFDADEFKSQPHVRAKLFAISNLANRRTPRFRRI